MNSIPRKANQLFVDPAVVLETRPDGSQLFRSKIELPEKYARCVGEWLEHWAAVDPDRLFLAERDADGEWVRLSYGEAKERVYRIGSCLLGQNLSAHHPVVILSDNSIEHALLMLAAMHVGVPSCAISSGNSLMSKDFAKLKDNIALLRPGLIYADPITRFMPAINALDGLHEGLVVAGGRSEPVPGTVPFSDLEAGVDAAAVASAFAAITPDTIGKFLFTSGSVGTPKAVINTHRMMCSSQAAKEMTWPFLRKLPPVLLDWLPWSHTFGSNHNFNLVLRWGGTLYIDEGKPTPAALGKTIRNLKEISPTLYFSVPRAFDMLVPHLRDDPVLRENFFRQLQVIFYAGAALPQHLWNELENLSRLAIGTEVTMTSSWGSTETAPTATDCHFQAVRSGVIGVPVPGTTLKLVPKADKLEVRVGGPNVFPGYWKQPDLSTAAFDEEGYYLIGDAVEFVDPKRPELGLLFDGRVGEDFKLLTGTWVHVGSLRVAGIDAFSPVAQDIVVTGHDRDEIGFLVFPNIPECRTLCPGLPPETPVEQVLSNIAVVQRIRQGMAMMAQLGGSSTYPVRVMLMEEPPSIEAGEITDKGYINQKIVRTRRADLVEWLYADVVDKSVITVATALG
ncbi:feruloyl-CoA synthase [Herminiimonas sp. CN]|uniref:feruloyl-CoA synthase n=1 Tax=Herminiimonas sp. CN TaxID=1349818 RepID=UPI000473B24C|nr:feruloyl-CoA synthase [Herminiimonas sp. CN]